MNSHIYGSCNHLAFHMNELGFYEITGTAVKQQLAYDIPIECNWYLQKFSSVVNTFILQKIKEEPDKTHLSFSQDTHGIGVIIVLPDSLYEKTYSLLKDAFLSIDTEYCIDFVNFDMEDIFLVDEFKIAKVYSGKNILNFTIGRQLDD